ncbi:MAG: GGDEF domain-containing protein [Spirochaetaceae bacterium]|nr:GGDEF domain-containing protein [Spirochaetaceae bacterium]
MHLSSKWRLIGLISLILFIAFSTIILMDFLSARNSMKTEIIRSSLPLLSENIYSVILHDLLPSIQAASLMANDSFLVKWVEEGEEDLSEVSGFLDRIQDEYGFHSAFLISEASGRYYFPGGIYKEVSPSDNHDIWYYRFIDSGKEFDLDVDTDQIADDLLTIFINYRLENSSGELLGVTGVGIEMEGFSGFLTEQQKLFDRIIYLIDDSGIIQAHSDLSRIEQVDIHEVTGLRLIADEILDSVSDAYYGEYVTNGRTIVITARFIPEIDWYIIVEQDEFATMIGIRRRLVDSMMISLLAFILVLTLSIITINRYDSRMATMVITDVLTGVANRRALEAALPRMLYRRNRRGSAVTLILIDLDNFKALNDKFGHPAGDAVLTSFARTTGAVIRQEDLLVRWGGDEFIIVSETDVDGAKRVADEIRKRFTESETRITLSIGIAEADDDDNPASLIKKADQAMYGAKNSGKNQTIFHTSPEVI